MARIKVDLHNIYNNSAAIDRALQNAFEDAIEKKIREVEIIPGKGSGQFRNFAILIKRTGVKMQEITYTGGKYTVAGSYGASLLSDANNDPIAFKTENALISGGLYYQATKSLKVVFELNYATTKDKEASSEKNSSIAPAIGMMLFF